MVDKEKYPDISSDIFILRESLKEIKIVGHYINITQMTFSLRKIYNFFSDQEIFFILGFNKDDNLSLEKIEKEFWSLSLIIRSEKNDKFIGFFRVYMLHESERIIGIHGGCVNSSLYEKICLIEAWYLLIIKCIHKLNCKEIRTTCLMGNKNAHKLILASGFKEVGKINNLLKFVLDFNAFERQSSRFTRWYLGKENKIENSLIQQ